MKRIVSASLALAVLAALVMVLTTSKPVYAQGVCSVATLKGNYGFSQPGFEPRGPNPNANKLPFAVVGVIAFDGGGNFSITYTDVSPGQPDPYVPLHGTGSGTYTVNSDCTGSGSCTTGDCAGVTFDTVILAGGKEVFGINTLPGVVATIDLKKQ